MPDMPEDFEWIPVSSSNLDAVSYDDILRRLFVRFKSGSVYQYENVPKGKYQGLISAASKGSFFHQHIKGVYGFTRLA